MKNMDSALTKLRIQRLIMPICVIALSPLSLLGWSSEAHRAIAMIAAKRMEGSRTIASITAILGNLTLADISTCPDEVRDLEEHGTKLSTTCAVIFPEPPKGTAPWHFVNTPIKALTFTPTPADVSAACMNSCAIVEVENYFRVLSQWDPSDTGAKKLADEQALAYVVHFIGDIHQPLHAAERDGDRGGNAVKVDFFNSKNLTLHEIWDNQIVARIDKTPQELVIDLRPEIQTATAEPSVRVTDWAIQSYTLARDVAYKGIPDASSSNKAAAPVSLGQAYQDMAAPVVRLQIARAGVRLASHLQSVLQ